MQIRTFAVGCIACSTALLGQPAQAVLIDQGLTTLDTITGLAWLDLSSTTNRSINDIKLNLESGGKFEGYRYATGLEVIGLFANAGFAPGIFRNYGPASPPFSSVNELITLVGVTNNLPNSDLLRASFGYYREDAANKYGIARLQTWVPDVDVFQSLAEAYGVETSLNSQYPLYGSWLVSNVPEGYSVPEGHSLYLLMFGLLALGATKKCVGYRTFYSAA